MWKAFDAGIRTYIHDDDGYRIDAPGSWYVAWEEGGDHRQPSPDQCIVSEHTARKAARSLNKSGEKPWPGERILSDEDMRTKRQERR